MITQGIKKKYSKQLNYFQSQIPLSVQQDIIPTSTVEHFHQIISEIEEKSGEDLSRFRIPELESEMEENKEEGPADTFKIITGIQRTLRKLFRTKPSSEKEVAIDISLLFSLIYLYFTSLRN